MSGLGECRINDSGTLSLKGVGSVIECKASWSYSSLDDLYSLVRELAKRVEHVLGVSINRIEFTENEPIGLNYMLFKYRLYLREGYISCRLIAHGNTVKLVVCTIPLKQGERSVESYNEPKLESAPKRNVVGMLPPGQKYVQFFTIYRILGQPEVDVRKWRLRITGLVEEEAELSYEELQLMPCKEIVVDFHCVTGWSVKGVKWSGVPLKHLAGLAGVKDNAKWVLVKGLDGYTTSIPLEDFLHEDSLLALRLNGKPLSIEQGFPARIIIPHLYGWKGVKWVSEIVFTDKYVDGFWEKLGYHPRGNVWLEERFKDK